MEIRDGFIIGVFNYCDLWCEQCALTSYCRVFADSAERDAVGDPAMRSLVEAPLPPEEEPAPPPAWLGALIDQANKNCAEDTSEYAQKPIPLAHRPLEARAAAYASRVFDWLHSQPEGFSAIDPRDPQVVVHYFGHYIAAKVHRATFGLANFEDDEFGYPADHDGSAKAALLAIERSHAAWQALVGGGCVSASMGRPFLADLEWLRREIEKAFPNCRSFIRPGLDEPDAVARLIAEGA